MIDTDKYEGHAEGEWTIEMNDTGDECQIIAQDYGTIAQTFYRDSDKLFYATLRLIADAPLLLEEVKRLRKELECWGKMLEIYGINNERMSAVLSFAFGDGDSSMSYLESILSLSEKDLKWYEDTHGKVKNNY